jgi:hypothetical protein
MWTPLIAGTVAPFAGRHSIFTTAAVGNDGAKKMTTIGNVSDRAVSAGEGHRALAEIMTLSQCGSCAREQQRRVIGRRTRPRPVTSFSNRIPRATTVL